MANSASLRGGEKNVQDWINLICGVLLFASPWVLRFSGDPMAARTAWIGGAIIFLMGLFALMQFYEWEEWVALIVGALVIISPWALGFAAIQAAMWACVVLGVIVVLSSISEIWAVHHPAAMAGR
jgi:SPW repeat